MSFDTASNNRANEDGGDGGNAGKVFESQFDVISFFFLTATVKSPVWDGLMWSLSPSGTTTFYQSGAGIRLKGVRS